MFNVNCVHIKAVMCLKNLFH